MNLKELRERQNLSVEDVASRLGVSASSIQKWESGKNPPTRNPQQMLDLIELYDITLEQLVEAVNESKGEPDG